MKVLLVNGSPHKNGCTYTALCEVSSALNENGISTDIFGLETSRFQDVLPAENVRKKINASWMIS